MHKIQNNITEHAFLNPSDLKHGKNKGKLYRITRNTLSQLNTATIGFDRSNFNKEIYLKKNKKSYLFLKCSEKQGSW